ncbi:MAG: hypothetical protein HQK54_11975 [Oligoflexales bacterium]|nr:hypothetical protein [Oligoflexales bacterium]
MKGSIRHFFRFARYRLPLPVFGIRTKRHYLYVDNAAKIISAILNGSLRKGIYLPHDPESWDNGSLFSQIYFAANNRALPRLYRIPMPGIVASVLSRINSLEPLFNSFELASNFSHAYSKLKLTPYKQAFKETAAGLTLVSSKK